MSKPIPHTIVRPQRLKQYIPLGQTVLDELMKSGLLEVVPLTPGGRAKGITVRSIIQYQRDVMKLEPMPDSEAAIVQPAAARDS